MAPPSIYRVLKKLKDRILNKLGSYFLERNAHANKVQRMCLPFSDVKRIGIVYNAASKENTKVVMRFAEEMEKKGKKINTLGYLNTRELTGDFIPNYRNDFFCNRDLNNIRLPKEMSVKRFISEPFDYLLNLNVEQSFALLGISALSKAHFRIGKYWKDYTECFDFMIQIREDTLESLITEISKYLNINEQ